MASLLKVPYQQAQKIMNISAERYNLSGMARETGIPRNTLSRYISRGFETAPFWAVCRILRYTGMTDEDRLKLIRCYTGEKDEKRTV